MTERDREGQIRRLVRSAPPNYMTAERDLLAIIDAEREARVRAERERNAATRFFVVANGKLSPDEHAHYMPTKHDVLLTYEAYVVAIEASEYFGDDQGEEEKCPKDYLVLVDAEQEILGFAPRRIAHKIAKSLNLASQAATLLDNEEEEW